MFPQVAPKFFETPGAGTEELGKDPAAQAAEAKAPEQGGCGRSGAERQGELRDYAEWKRAPGHGGSAKNRRSNAAMELQEREWRSKREQEDDGREDRRALSSQARGVGARRRAERIEKQHAGGKLTARERVAGWWTRQLSGDRPVCAASLDYFGMAGKEMPADGVVTGCAKIDGRLVHLASQDFTVGGGVGRRNSQRQGRRYDGLSLKTGSPFVFINDSGGARVQEGIDSLAGYGRVFYHNVCSPAWCRRFR